MSYTLVGRRCVKSTTNASSGRRMVNPLKKRHPSKPFYSALTKAAVCCIETVPWSRTTSHVFTFFSVFFAFFVCFALHIQQSAEITTPKSMAAAWYLGREVWKWLYGNKNSFDAIARTSRIVVCLVTQMCPSLQISLKLTEPSLHGYFPYSGILNNWAWFRNRIKFCKRLWSLFINALRTRWKIIVIAIYAFRKLKMDKKSPLNLCSFISISWSFLNFSKSFSSKWKRSFSRSWSRLGTTSP